MTETLAGRFTLVDQIGSGGAGAVWRAYDLRERKFCAVKVMRPRDAEALIRVVREQGVRLRHPHILSPYAWAADDDAALIASDVVAGGSLLGLIRDHGALPWRYAAEIIAQLLDALAQVHQSGLVHRDVKPGNVLLEVTGTGRPHARLADFGITHPTGGPRLTQAGLVLGTPGYLAPEVLAGQGPEPGQDLFAAGVLAWQLLTGDDQATNRTDRIPPGVPEPLWQVVQRLLEPDPLARTSGTAAAGTLLRDLMNQHPLDLPTRNSGGELLEVFDVIGPLPHKWTTAESAPAESAPAESAAPPLADRTKGVPAPTMPNPPPAGPPPRRTGRRWPWVAIGMTAATSIVVAVLLTRPDQPPGHDQETNTPVPTPTVPGTRSPQTDIKVGAECDWQDVDQQEVSADGQPVRCTYQEGGHPTWQAVG